MKKSIVLFALCLFAFANIQTAQAQTKEETIAWIKEKISIHLFSPTSRVRFNDGGNPSVLQNLTITPCLIS